jgi:hypothetical protein
MSAPYQTDRITHPAHPGWAFLVKHHYDSDLGAPWEEHDCHGEVTERRAPRYPHRYSTGKAAGEVVIHYDSGTYWCYDYAGAMKKAKRDGWGLGADGLDNLKLELAHHQIRRVEFDNYKARAAAAVELAATITPTPGQIRRAAVDADMKRMRGWLRNDWHWCWIEVKAVEAPEGIDIDDLDFQSLGGLESDGEDYIMECDRELAAQIAGPAMEAKAAADAARAEAERVAADKQARLIAALLSAWGTIDHARFACNPEVVMTECDWNTVQGHLAAALHDIDGRVMPARFRNQGKPIYTVWDYAAILDSVYEMADDISNGNAISPRAAILQTLKV